MAVESKDMENGSVLNITVDEPTFQVMIRIKSECIKSTVAKSIFPLLSRLVLPQGRSIPIIVITDYDEEMAANSKNTSSENNIDNTLDEPVMTNRNNLEIDEPAFQVMIH